MDENSGGLTHDAKTWGMFCHLAGFGKFIFPFFGNVIGPLIVWQLKKNESEFIDYHGKESLNFQITISIVVIVLIPTLFILIGFVLLPMIGLFDAIMIIIAALKASNGERYQYPLTIRFVK
jgi:uncharacterized protein